MRQAGPRRFQQRGFRATRHLVEQGIHEIIVKFGMRLQRQDVGILPEAGDLASKDATLRLMDIAVENSNYSEVKELSEKFVKICKNLCKENERILESLKDLEPKNDS